jgi:hypothetical protein
MDTAEPTETAIGRRHGVANGADPGGVPGAVAGPVVVRAR